MRGAVRESRKAEAAPKCEFGGHDIDPAITDPRLYALWIAGGETSSYEPGAWQGHLLNRLGLQFGGYADPGGVLTELATLALKDRGATLKQAEDMLKSERASIDEQLAVIEPLRAELAEAQQHAEDLAEQVALGRTAAADLAAQLAQEKRITTVLRSADQPPAEPKRKAPAKPTA